LYFQGGQTRNGNSDGIVTKVIVKIALILKNEKQMDAMLAITKT